MSIRQFRDVVGVVLLLSLAACTGGSGDGAGGEDNQSGGEVADQGQDRIDGSSPEAGRLLSTGLNDSGQLGRESAETSSAFAPVRGLDGNGTLTDVVAAAGGARHSLAVRADGSVLAWGANDEGQLGDGTRTARDAPVRVRAPAGQRGSLTGALDVAADTDFSMALMRDGTVVTWGQGDTGQRGTGKADETALRPTTVLGPDGSTPLRNVASVSADGGTEVAVLDDGRVLTWGANEFGQLGDGSKDPRALPGRVEGVQGTGSLAGVTDAAVGGQHVVAALEDGRAVSWGNDDRGQLGNGSETNRAVPGPVPGLDGFGRLVDVAGVAAAEKHSFALTGDGDLYGWGDNAAGQVGSSALGVRNTPVRVRGPSGDPTLSDARAVFAGEAYGVALRTGGELLTWGANGNGQLGSGDTTPRTRPGPAVTEDGAQVDDVLVAGPGERHLLIVVGAE